MKVKVLVPQSCPTLCGLMNCSPSGSSVYGILQERTPGVGCHFLLHLYFCTFLNCVTFFQLRQTFEKDTGKMKWLNISLGRAEVRFTILEDRSKETLQNTVQRGKEIKSRRERLNWNSKDWDKEGQYLKS